MYDFGNSRMIFQTICTFCLQFIIVIFHAFHFFLGNYGDSRGTSSCLDIGTWLSGCWLQTEEKPRKKQRPMLNRGPGMNWALPMGDFLNQRDLASFCILTSVWGGWGGGRLYITYICWRYTFGQKNTHIGTSSENHSGGRTSRMDGVDLDQEERLGCGNCIEWKIQFRTLSTQLCDLFISLEKTGIKTGCK